MEKWVSRVTWRLSLHARQFSDKALKLTELADITHARGRRLERKLNDAATFTFTVDGRSDVARLIREMETDVVVWRTDDRPGAKEVMYGRFIVAQSEDVLTAESHSVVFTCHDYFAMLNRRYLTKPVTYTGQAQNAIVIWLLQLATTGLTSADGLKSFMPGSYLPLRGSVTAPDGGPGANGPPRDRTYTAQSSIGQLITDLAAVIGNTPAGTAFDFDVRTLGGVPFAPTFDTLRIFNGGQGVTNDDAVLEYGGNVAGLTRSANTQDYSNFVRLVGQATGGQDVPPIYSEAWDDDANDVGITPVGVWQEAGNASDVSIQATLDQQAAGRLNASAVLIPSYSLTLRPGTYREGWVNMGDTVPLVVRSGRLDVLSSVRVVGTAFDISEDGPEVVTLTVGRPPTSLVDLLQAGAADVDALARR